MDNLTSINIEEITLYINIGAYLIIALGVLSGFIKGAYKSMYFFIISMIIFIGGWFLMPIFTNHIINYNLGSKINYSFNGVELVTIADFVPKVIIKQYPQMEAVLISGSASYSLVMAFTRMVINLSYIFILIILNMTILKFITWIIWLIIKPKNRDPQTGKKRKKHLPSRLIGAGIGFLEAVFIIFLMSIPLSGAFSIANSTSVLIEDSKEISKLNNRYMLFVKDDKVLLLERNTLENEIDNDKIKEILEIFKNYRNTSFGKISGFIKIKDIALDEYVFDEIFSLNIAPINENEKNIKVKLREELSIISAAFAKLIEANDGSTKINEDILSKLSSNEIEEIFGYISKLELIKVVIPIGMEYVVNSGQFDNVLKDYKDNIDIEELKKINFLNELNYIGDIFADAVTLYDPNVPIKDINYFAFDSDKVIQIFNNLSELGIVQYAAPIGMDLLLNNKSLQDFFDKYQIDKDALTYPLEDEWNVEIKKIGYLYEAFQDLGIESVEHLKTFSKDKNFFENLPDDKISNFVEKLMEFNLVNKNSEISTTLIYESINTILPDSYKSLIKKEMLSENFNAKEVSNLLMFGKFVVTTGIFENNDGNINYSELMTDENISKLTTYISDSNIITSNVPDLLNGLVTALNLNINLNIPSDINWKNEIGKNELSNILNTTKELLDINLFSGFSIDKLTDENIDKLSYSMSSSKVIKENLNTIIDLFTQNQNLEFKLSLPSSSDDWTENEIKNVFKSAKILITNGGDANSLFKLTEDEMNFLLGSKIISRTIVSALKEYTAADVIEDGVIVKEAGALYNLLIISNVKNDNDWYDVYDSNNAIIKDGELRKLLTAFKLILGEDFNVNNLSQFDINNIISLSDGSIDPLDDQIKTVLSSVVTLDSIINQMIKYSNENPNLIVNIEAASPYWKDIYDDKDNLVHHGEIRRIIKSFKILYKDEQIDINNLSMKIDLIRKLDASDINYISNSIIISDTVEKNIINETTNPKGFLYDKITIPENVVWRSEGNQAGELELLFKALNILVDENQSLTDYTFSSIKKIYSNDEFGNIIPGGIENQNTLLSSKIIAATIIDKIEEESNKMDSIIVIPDNLNWDNELVNIINALSVIVPSGEINNININFKNIYVRRNDNGVILDNGTYGQDTVLKSKIIFESIKNNLVLESLKETSSIVIPNDIIWEGKEGELVKLIDALSILAPTGNIEDINLNLSDLYLYDQLGNVKPKGQFNQDIVLSSRIITSSIISKVEDEASNSSSYIVIPDGIIWEGVNGELKNLINALNVLAPNGDIENISFNLYDIYDVDELGNEITLGKFKQDIVLSSKIITASIKNKINLEANNNVIIIPSNINWENDNTELINLIHALSIIAPDGNIDNVSLRLTDFFIKDEFGNEKPSGKYKRDTLLLSLIISASIVKQIEDESIKPYSLIKIPEGEIQWNDYNGYEGELKLILNGLNILLGNKDIDEINLDLNLILNKDLSEVLDSKVLENSLVYKVKEIINGDLSIYIKPSYDDREYDWYKNINAENPNGDLLSLLEVLRDLGNNHNIDYNNITFESMLNATNSEQKSQDLNDLLLSSNIIENSLTKMFTKVLSDAGFGEGRININPNNSDTYWQGNLDNQGELLLLLLGINALDNFENIELSSINSINKDEFNLSLKVINKSSILRQILGDVVDRGLSSASDWKYSDKDPKNLTKEEWDDEIDVLVDLIVLTNDPTTSISLNSLNINIISNDEADNLGKLLKLISRSRILDINKISEFMSFGIRSAFNDVIFTNELGVVSTYPNGDSYEDKVMKWNGTESIEGEIDIIVSIIKQLNSISPILIDRIINEYSYAQSMGQFFNLVKKSILLKPVLLDLVNYVVPNEAKTYFSFDENTDYEITFIQIHTLLNSPFFK